MSVTERPAPADMPIIPPRVRTLPDRVFRGLLMASSAVVLLVIGSIALYLLLRSNIAWRYTGLRFFTSDGWAPRAARPSYGIFGALTGSLTIAALALVVALPISFAMALAINEYAPRRLRRPLTTLVDLLAALPSLVFGLWGVFFLGPRLFLTSKWLSHHADFVPLFRVSEATYGNSLFVCGVVVGVMILPILTSVSREIMAQTPRDQCEAALALGGTRWGMITDVVVPFSRNGIIGGALLGLGRALGETIAVTLILAPTYRVTGSILSPGGGTIPSLIASEFNGSSEQEQSALVLAGLTLFAVTLVINLGARAIVHRAAEEAR